MPTDLFTGQVLLGFAQAAAAIVLCLAVAALCLHFQVRVGREAAVSLLRGLVQMSFVGVVLGLLLKGNLLIGMLILLGMVAAAAATASRRFAELPYAFQISLYSIGAGAGTVIVFMLFTKSLDTNIAVLVPVGSMIIANCMNACAQAMERFKADVLAHVGQIEAALCLGAEPAVSVAPYVQTSVYASLLPRLDMLKSLGLVWIPGVMAGMMVSGASPLYAGLYQFVVVAMILAASGISGMGVTTLMRRRAFSAAGQLLLRPSIATAPAPRPFLSWFAQRAG
ncbi:ABC transporter permease [Rhizobium sp. BK251]|uniref:ABC transporter permease n=1 Tax=Rhizobium sp. BK251 TaxID=2512125 RepID=UPI001051524A|nr:ABC transporter permease [Rhizobium sp. BK251]TCL70149.1 putative ABC transport system permease protein [Rhizobium sp. BK251]